MSREKNKLLEKRTEKFALQVIRLCSALPFNSVNKVLVDQLLRAAGSIGANYIEANESLSKADFIYRIKICRKESRESQYWIRLVSSANKSAQEQFLPLQMEAQELFLIFCSILKR